MGGIWMKQQTCKIIFTVFALFVLFLSCDHFCLNEMSSSEQFENVSQNESFFEGKFERTFVLTIFDESLLNEITYKEESYQNIEHTGIIVLNEKMIPVGILAPPFDLF